MKLFKITGLVFVPNMESAILVVYVLTCLTKLQISSLGTCGISLLIPKLCIKEAEEAAER